MIIAVPEMFEKHFRCFCCCQPKKVTREKKCKKYNKVKPIVKSSGGLLINENNDIVVESMAIFSED